MKTILFVCLIFWSEAFAHSSSIDRFRGWCQERLRVLKRAHENALFAHTRGRHRDALRILTNGLKEAEKGIAGHNTSGMTAKAIIRGNILAKKAANIMGTDSRSQRGLIHLLFGYYDFVSRVSSKLDIPRYTLSLRHIGGNQSVEMERLYVRFAKRQVEFVVKHTVETSYQHGHETVYPLGDAKIYLKLLELMASFAVTDLQEGIYSYRYACIIESLQALSERLTAYNQGKDGGYGNDFHAVNSSYFELMEILGQSRGGKYSRCH